MTDEQLARYIGLCEAAESLREIWPTASIGNICQQLHAIIDGEVKYRNEKKPCGH